MTPSPTNLASEPTVDPADSQQPSEKPPTRASDLDASDAGLQTSAVSPDHVAASGRYVLTAFHARGGMGEVWRCQDATMGREVALKRLVSDRAAARERFLCEAQVTGQLQHPGIVPIHDLGFDDAGRPYYVMTFVQGRTLKAAIESFYADDRAAAAAAAGQRQLERTRLLKVFLDICNAVAYAHSRGIIHRDLKPDNVMLGPFGETVLLDWGLAKLKGHSDRAGAPATSMPPPPALSGSAAHTEDGSIMGSPLYMPPEMASGHTVDADQRTDVYLLGATLYEVLTGRPPREGGSREEILELARTAPPVPPRKLRRDTPRALEAICLKAMANDPSRRYPSAEALAEDVQRYMAGEPVRAYREPLPARMWRAAKRHGRGIARATAAIVVIGCATATALLYRDASQARAREAARVDLAHVRHLVDESRYYAANIEPPGQVAPYYDVGRAEQTARAALAQAERWGPTLAGLPLIDERDPLRRELSELCLRLVQIRLAGRDALAASTGAADAMTLLDRSDNLADGRASRTSHRLRAQAYRAAQRDAEAVAEEQLAAAGDKEGLSAHELFLEAETLRLRTASQFGVALNDAAARRAAAKAMGRAVDLYQASLRKDPSDYWTRFQLGRAYLALGRGREAVETLSGCIGLRPQAPWAYSSRALALALLHRFDEAKLDIDRALELDRNFVAARLNRGIMFRLQDRSADAAAEFDALLSLPNAPPEAAIYRGQLFLLADEPEQALRLFGTSPHPQLCLLRADAHLRLGRPDDAIRALDALVPRGSGEIEAAAVRGRQLRCIAANLPRQHQAIALQLAATELRKAVAGGAAPAAVLADLGAVLHAQGLNEAAIEPLTLAAARSPDDAQPLINRGWVNVSLDRLADAQRDFAAALRLSPDNPEALTGVGYVAARGGNAREAQLEASLAMIHGSADYRILHNVACIYAQLSLTDRQQAAAQEAAAVGLLRRAIDAWRRGWGGPHELDLIQNEVAFPASLRQRADFRQLLGDTSAAPAAAASPDARAERLRT